MIFGIGTPKTPMSQQFRDLSYLEKYFYWRTNKNYYTNYRILVEYSIDLTPEKLYYALSKLLYKHSPLTMDIMPCKNLSSLGYGFTILENIKLNDIVEFINDDTLDNAEEICNKFQYEHFIYSTGKPLWRLKVINSRYILFYCDHILFDGTSGKNFHIKLSNELNNEIPSIVSQKFNGLDSLIFQKSLVEESYQVFPSPTDIINYSGPILTTIYKLLVELLPKNLSNLIKYWFSKNPYSRILSYEEIQYRDVKINSNLEDCCKIINLNSDEINSIIKLCRSKNVKLTSLMVILANMSAGKFINGLGKDTVTSIPVNIRGSIDEKKAKNIYKHYTSLFGLYMSVVNIELPSINKICPNDEVNWSTVQYVNNFIHNNVKISPMEIGLLRYIDVKDYVIERYRKKEMPTIEISNLGMIGGEHKNIVNAWFDQPSQIFSINMISTQNGTNMVLRSQNPEWANGFKNGLEKSIHSLI